MRIAKASASPQIMAAPTETLLTACSGLQRFDEARQIIHEAQARKLGNFILHNALYALAFLVADFAAEAGNGAERRLSQLSTPICSSRRSRPFPTVSGRRILPN